MALNSNFLDAFGRGNGSSRSFYNHNKGLGYVPEVLHGNIPPPPIPPVPGSNLYAEPGKVITFRKDIPNWSFGLIIILIILLVIFGYFTLKYFDDKRTERLFNEAKFERMLAEEKTKE